MHRWYYVGSLDPGLPRLVLSVPYMCVNFTGDVGNIRTLGEHRVFPFMLPHRRFWFVCIDVQSMFIVVLSFRLHCFSCLLFCHCRTLIRMPCTLLTRLPNDRRVHSHIFQIGQKSTTTTSPKPPPKPPPNARTRSHTCWRYKPKSSMFMMLFYQVRDLSTSPVGDIHNCSSIIWTRSC